MCVGLIWIRLNGHAWPNFNGARLHTAVCCFQGLSETNEWVACPSPKGNLGLGGGPGPHGPPAGARESE
jgi:hypothetical protein